MKRHKNTNVSYFCDGAVKMFTEQVKPDRTRILNPGGDETVLLFTVMSSEMCDMNIV